MFVSVKVTLSSRVASDCAVRVMTLFSFDVNVRWPSTLSDCSTPPAMSGKPKPETTEVLLIAV